MLISVLFLSFSVLLTSVLSGTLGLGGGSILLGILLLNFPVAQTMVLHGVIQLASNGSRVWFFRKHIDRKANAIYFIGSIAALLLLSGLSLVLPKFLLFLTLGAKPLLAILLPQWISLHFVKPSHALLCGFVITGTQVLFGVSGPLLELFFVNSRLSKEEIMANKALSQSIGHLAKIVFYSRMFHIAGSEELLIAGVLFAIFGNALGKKLNKSMSEKNFTFAYKFLLTVISIAFIYKGIVEFLERQVVSL